MNNSEAQPIETSFFANNIFYKWALFLFTYNQVKTKTIWQHQTLDLFMPFHPKITSQKTVKFGLFEKHTHFEKMLLMVLTLLSKSADLSKPWRWFFQILCVTQKVQTLWYFGLFFWDENLLWFLNERKKNLLGPIRGLFT